MVTLWIKGPSRVKASGGQCGMHETEIIERLQLLVKIQAMTLVVNDLGEMEDKITEGDSKN